MSRMIAPLGALLFFAAAFCVGEARAIDVATGPLGSNVQAVRNAATRNANETRTLGWNLTGTGVNLGQIEGGRPGDPDLTDGLGPPAPELFHPAINPGGGTIGVAIAGTTAVSGTDNNMFLRAHATSVAGMMVASNQGGSMWGTAPNATLYSSSLNPVATTVGASVVAGGEWMRLPPVARFVNHSYGIGRAGSLDISSTAAVPVNGSLNGNHQMTLYLDWSTFHHDILHVVAGDESLFQRNSIWEAPSPQTRDELGIDAYNSIVVGATGQRAGVAGRYDQVANFSNSNRTEDARVWRTDIVAPGGESSSIQIRQRNNTPGHPNFGTFTGMPPARTVDVFPANNLTNEDYFPDLAGAFTSLGAGDPNMPTLTGNPPNAFGMARNAGTSFAAPQVTAVAGLMQQYANDNGFLLDHRVTKAALLNAASKHVLSKPADTNANDIADTPGQSWTQRYETRYNNIPTSISQSRDPDIGFGQLNGISSIKQIANGTIGSAVAVKSTSLAAGASFVTPLFVGGETLKAGSLVTATLAWDRVVNTSMADPTVAQLQNPANYVIPGATNSPGGNSPISDLDIRLVKRGGGSTVAYVLSFKDNVEQLYFNIREAGDYDLVVDNRSNRTVQYGMALSAGSSTGMAFTMDRFFAQGKQMPRFTADANWPNDVNALGGAGQGGFSIGGEVFSSNLNGSNMQRVSGGLGTKSRVGPHLAVPAAQNLLDNSKGALGLVADDQIMGLSWGRDGSLLNGLPLGSVITFSVDHGTDGAAGSAVRGEAVLFAQPGDVFRTPRLDPFGKFASDLLRPAPDNSNRMHIQEHQLGLWAPDNGPSLVTTPGADNLRDFEHDNILDYTDTDGDGIINNAAFFALGRFSPTVVAGGASSSDILIAAGQDPTGNFDLNMPGAGFNYQVFAPGGAFGLQPMDGIDGLILSRTGFSATFVPLLDEALFSLDPLSTSVTNGTARPGAIYYTNFARAFDPLTPWYLGGSLFATPEQIGLLSASDNIDGLDIFSIPEPASIALVAICALTLLIRRRHKNLAAASTPLRPRPAPYM